MNVGEKTWRARFISSCLPGEDLELLVRALALDLDSLALRKASSAESMNRKPERRWSLARSGTEPSRCSWVTATVKW